jgi:hypothetical protein
LKSLTPVLIKEFLYRIHFSKEWGFIEG